MKKNRKGENPADYLVFIIEDKRHALYSDTLITRVPEIFWKLANIPLRLMNLALIFSFNNSNDSTTVDRSFKDIVSIQG